MNKPRFRTSKTRPVADNRERSVIPFTTRLARPNNGSQKHRINGSGQKLRLGHVHLKVRDLNRSVPFYTRILGLSLTEWVGRFAFLAIGDEHHSVALEEIGVWSVNPSRRAVGVAHVAFEVPNRADFMAMRRKLAAIELPFISRNNGMSWAIRFKDPDGNEIEIYVDRRHSPEGTRLWEGRWHGPPKLEVAVTSASKFGTAPDATACPIPTLSESARECSVPSNRHTCSPS